jgi:hypothetical protein
MAKTRNPRGRYHRNWPGGRTFQHDDAPRPRHAPGSAGPAAAGQSAADQTRMSQSRSVTGAVRARAGTCGRRDPWSPGPAGPWPRQHIEQPAGTAPRNAPAGRGRSAKDPDQAVGKGDDIALVAPGATPGSARARRRPRDRRPHPLPQSSADFGQRGHVPQAQVVALPATGCSAWAALPMMTARGAVTAVAVTSSRGYARARPRIRKPAGAGAELRLQQREERRVVEGQGRGAHGVTAGHHAGIAVGPAGSSASGPCGVKRSKARSPTRRGQADVADDGGLAVGPHAGIDAQRRPQRERAPSATTSRRASERGRTAVLLDGHPQVLALRFYALSPSPAHATAQLSAPRGPPQRGPDAGVADDVAQRRHAFTGRIDDRRAEPALLGTWMRRIGAASVGQRARGRGLRGCAGCFATGPRCARSKLGWAGRTEGHGLGQATRRSRPASATARLAPTMPPPATRTSQTASPPAVGRARVLMPRRPTMAADDVGVAGQVGREHLGTVGRDQHVVLDAHTDAPPALRHPAHTLGDVYAGLHGQRHARLEHPPGVGNLVVTDIVDVHAEPVARAMHEELLVAATAHDAGRGAVQQPEAAQPAGHGPHGGIVGLTPGPAGRHGPMAAPWASSTTS